MTKLPTNTLKVIFWLAAAIVFGIVLLFWPVDSNLDVKIAVYIFGGTFVHSYVFKTKMIGPGFMVGAKNCPTLRFLVFLLGVVIMLTALFGRK